MLRSVGALAASIFLSPNNGSGGNFGFATGGFSGGGGTGFSSLTIRDSRPARHSEELRIFSLTRAVVSPTSAVSSFALSNSTSSAGRLPSPASLVSHRQDA